MLPGSGEVNVVKGRHHHHLLFSSLSLCVAEFLLTSASDFPALASSEISRASPLMCFSSVSDLVHEHRASSSGQCSSLVPTVWSSHRTTHGGNHSRYGMRAAHNAVPETNNLEIHVHGSFDCNVYIGQESCASIKLCREKVNCAIVAHSLISTMQRSNCVFAPSMEDSQFL